MFTDDSMTTLNVQFEVYESIFTEGFNSYMSLIDSFNYYGRNVLPFTQVVEGISVLLPDIEQMLTHEHAQVTQSATYLLTLYAEFDSPLPPMMKRFITPGGVESIDDVFDDSEFGGGSYNKIKTRKYKKNKKTRKRIKKKRRNTRMLRRKIKNTR